MADQNVGSAVVLDHGRLIGIDHRARPAESDGRTRASERGRGAVDDRRPSGRVAVDDDDGGRRIMLEQGFRHLPVVDEERTLGIVSLRDVVRDELAAES